VVAKGLAVLYKAQPNNPVDFLSKWLLNYAEVESLVLKITDRKEDVRELKDLHEHKQGEDAKKQMEVANELFEDQRKTNEFFKKID
jgi:hypothetical protein